MSVDLRLGDCLDVLPTLAANSVDSIITDPPYGLTFMGKDWDRGVPGPHFWAAALRVAKPGAMLLAFGGSRTFHRLTCAIEDAGWEIRDVLCWLYGSGFPKSHDISKAIDAQAGAEREVVGVNASAIRHKQRSTTWTGDVWGDNGATVTAPATPDAQEWDGWGTALKPAWESIILAMKPCDGTFAHNALTWGVAGLNVDGARIPTNPDIDDPRLGGNGAWHPTGKSMFFDGRGAAVGSSPSGRWPANVLLDEEAAAALDAQSGETSNGHWPTSRPRNTFGLGHTGQENLPERAADSGGASRFFYVAKASRRDRSSDGTVNNHHPTVKPLKLMEYLCTLTATPTGGVVLDPFMGSGTTGVACVQTGRNFIGCEIDAGYFEIAKRRIETAQAPLLEVRP